MAYTITTTTTNIHTRNQLSISSNHRKSFLTPSQQQQQQQQQQRQQQQQQLSSLFSSTTKNSNTDESTSSSSSWNGDIFSNTKDGRIRGCIIQPAQNGVEKGIDALDRILLASSKNTDTDLISNTSTEWIIQIDGVQADLGRFSLAIYKKLLNDAKQQSYAGYRKGTIPPPLLTTYKAYTMDECARETILEAMEQNQIRPFETCRNDMILYDFSISPPSSSTTKTSNSSKSKNSKNKKKSSKTTPTTSPTTTPEESSDVVVSNIGDNNTTSSSSSTSTTTAGWTTYATMKEAIDIGGWQPGQSFSFCAKHLRGQSIKVGTPFGATPLGVDY